MKRKQLIVDNEKIEELAFENSIDYKPWETDLKYTEYYKEGFSVGYKKAIKDINKGKVK